MQRDGNDNFPVILEDIHIEPEKGSDSYLCRNFKLYPEGKEVFGGYLFGIIEIKATPLNEADRVFDALLNTLRTSYYQQITTSPTPQKLNLETIFEYALNKTNQALLEMIEIGQIHFIKENIHFFIGVAKQEDNRSTTIYFTNQGAINAFLIHRNKKNEYNTIALVDPAAEPEPPNERLKLFSAITSGVIAEKDILVVCTDVFNSYISPQKMRHILTNNDFDNAVDYFKAQIRQSSTGTLTHSAIFIKREALSAAEQPGIAQHSLTHFISTTENTEKLLTPSFSFNIKQRITGLFERFKRSPQNTESSTEHTRSTDGIRSFPLIVKTGFKNLYLMLRGRKAISLPQAREARQSTVSGGPGVLKRFRFPIILGFIIIIALVGFSVRWAQTSAAEKKANDQYASQVSKVRTMINDAESSFIYKNKPKSLAQLEQAKNELKFLPQSTDVQKTNFSTLEKQISDLQNKLLNIEKVVPTLVTELVVNGTTLPHTHLLAVKDGLLTFGDGTTVGKIDVTTNTLSALLETPEALTDGTYDTTDGTILLLSTAQNLYTIKDTTITPITPALTSTPVDISMYNGNIYTLDRDGQKIIKYKKAGAVLNAGTSWVKTMGTAQIANATSLTIDGSLYLLGRNGQIDKFYAGENQSFATPAYEPVIKNAASVVTSVDLPNLYLVDPGTKRLIIMNKTGVIAKQLVFDSLESITDIAISLDGKTAYILSGHKVYKTSL